MLYIPSLEKRSDELAYEYQRQQRIEQYYFERQLLEQTLQHDLKVLKCEYHPVD